MKTRSAKAKGRRLQDKVRKMLLETYPELREGDIKTAVMGESGRDIKFSPLADDIINFDVECKNVEKLNVWSAIKQAEENSKEDRIPLLVFKRNNSKIYAALELEKLLDLIKKT